MAKVKVSIVVTVFNEEKTIKSLLDVLCKFPAEIIIVDGGSTDKTWNILTNYISPLRLRGDKGVILKIIQGKYNRSQGRNIGVTKARGQIIAFTDAGCIPEPNWLEEITKPFYKKLPSTRLGEGRGVRYSEVQVVSGYYRGLPKNIFEKCLVPYVLVMPDKIPDEFLPSTRSMAITKELFIKSGGFDERLWHNEDYAFAHKLKNMGVNFYFASKAVVGWMPRKDLKSSAWMFLRFAIGDAQAGIFRPKIKILAIRYYIYFFLIFINSWASLLIVPYFIWAIFKNYKYVNNIGAFLWLPVLQLTSDICVLFGTIVVLLSRVK